MSDGVMPSSFLLVGQNSIESALKEISKKPGFDNPDPSELKHIEAAKCYIESALEEISKPDLNHIDTSLRNIMSALEEISKVPGFNIPSLPESNCINKEHIKDNLILAQNALKSLIQESQQSKP